MKTLFRRFFALIALFLILNSNSLGVVNAYRSLKDKEANVLRVKNSKNSKETSSSEIATNKEKTHKFYSYFPPSSPFHEKTNTSTTRLAKAHSKMLPVLPFFILNFVAKTVTNVANAFTAKLKEEIAELRKSTQTTLIKQINDIELILTNNCLFYKYLKFLSFSFITTVNFQISIFKGI